MVTLSNILLLFCLGLGTIDLPPPFHSSPSKGNTRAIYKQLCLEKERSTIDTGERGLHKKS